ncbi:MAG: hypothetical protein HJJLKODD_02361 [Phycisphaerae bacterium]|nr:hypothetical protein [Phycisphaerae bacterium]
MRRKCGFTLVELLVVVAIIALLISILLPSLASAREQARAIVCATHLGDVSKAVGIYLLESDGLYPPSYLYMSDAEGNVNWDLQGDNSYGYQHWSFLLYRNGAAKEEAFTCPSIPHGGHPASNPGKDLRNWEGGQTPASQEGQPTGFNPPSDRQAPRMAFMANGFIMPRNKFDTIASGGPRYNFLVDENKIDNNGKTILFAEYPRNWRTMAKDAGGSMVASRSHRPFVPAYSLSSGDDMYLAPPNSTLFYYAESALLDLGYGMRPLAEIDSAQFGYTITKAPIWQPINYIGRHHTGQTVNFMYVDTHVERKTPKETFDKLEWGTKIYSLTGKNGILGSAQDGVLNQDPDKFYSEGTP